VLAGLRGAPLCPPGDPAALARALAPLLVDAPARASAGRAARAHAEAALGWERHLDAVEDSARALAATR
jgi:glycosyltransferase involved in cell wall biosynthesis